VLADPFSDELLEVVHPRLRVALHQVIAPQLCEDIPAEVWQAAQRLLAAGYDRHVRQQQSRVEERRPRRQGRPDLGQDGFLHDVERDRLDIVLQRVHNIKGNASLLRLEHFESLAQAFEQKVIDLKYRTALGGDDFLGSARERIFVFANGQTSGPNAQGENYAGLHGGPLDANVNTLSQIADPENVRVVLKGGVIAKQI